MSRSFHNDLCSVQCDIDLCSLQDERANDPKAAPYLEPMGAYSKLPPREHGEEGEGEEEEDHKLTEKDLLSFARQIAAGMVRLMSTLSACIYLNPAANESHIKLTVKDTNTSKLILLTSPN